ncbi:LOW QUALITY PROTEIN: hypothetical protein Cgig2_009126 [Carnegiea gigantea]|uniref:Uncharacterized protein n=1 Tax=Carnegiea gigantea TaxID=171969 RepID=A0A9Q1K2P9_9CARY|nr:LOW QUALITY PROTEIN: hypothetical protein Cgig2_009126 [Carnegiea gigantea]
MSNASPNRYGKPKCIVPNKAEDSNALIRRILIDTGIRYHGRDLACLMNPNRGFRLQKINTIKVICHLVWIGPKCTANNIIVEGPTLYKIKEKMALIICNSDMNRMMVVYENYMGIAKECYLVSIKPAMEKRRVFNFHSAVCKDEETPSQATYLYEGIEHMPNDNRTLKTPSPRNCEQCSNNASGFWTVNVG